MRKEEQPIVERLREGIDLRPDFFGEEPPVWAQDSFNHDMAEKCGRCGSWAEVVRPGKTQCPCCGDDDEPALRLEAASTIEARQAEIERLRGELSKFADFYDEQDKKAAGEDEQLRRENERLTRLLDQATERLAEYNQLRDAAESEASALRKRVEELESALRPFGEAGRAIRFTGGVNPKLSGPRLAEHLELARTLTEGGKNG